MIVASRVTEYGGIAQKAGRAGAKPRKGIASALDEVQVHHPGGGAIHPNGQVAVPARRLASTDADQRVLFSLVLEQLVRGQEGYRPLDIISSGSSDYEFVSLYEVWHYEQFVVVREIHRPTVPAFGRPWEGYRAISFNDSKGIEELSSRLGLTGSDLE